MTDPISLLRADVVVARRGRSRAQLYVDVRRGVMTPPIHIGGGKLSAWPSHEIDAITRAEIASASPDELRALVQQLVTQRALGAPST